MRAAIWAIADKSVISSAGLRPPRVLLASHLHAPDALHSPLLAYAQDEKSTRAPLHATILTNTTAQHLHTLIYRKTLICMWYVNTRDIYCKKWPKSIFHPNLGHWESYVCRLSPPLIRDALKDEYTHVHQACYIRYMVYVRKFVARGLGRYWIGNTAQ